ncbi:TE2IP protein, partial [Neodrepanis coruscans]|nr:TE2IP protein [Neodrepanis coruscans]
AVRSRSLFLWDDGRPMRFYVRPGLAKMRVAPLVLAGGGRLCRVQEPGAVLLAQPGEAAPGGAVSADYVMECVKRNQRLPLEPFMLPAPASPHSRLAFTEEEDAALLQAVRDQSMMRLGTPALWMELERSGLTRHGWRAMRDRYLLHLLPLFGEPRPPEEIAQITGLFAAANREFESAESGSDSSEELSEELSTQDEVGNSPGETASDLKTGLEDAGFRDTLLRRGERPISTCSSSEVGDVVKAMQHFMKKFNVDLLTVTQAFLKNSGEVEATLYFLQTGQRLDGYPVWSREDDLELQKDDENVRNKLIVKFGAENVAKRIAFRKS